MSDAAIVVCQTCGMPARVVFCDDGEIAAVFSVCGHVDSRYLRSSSASEPTPDKESPDV